MARTWWQRRKPLLQQFGPYCLIAVAGLLWVPGRRLSSKLLVPFGRFPLPLPQKFVV